MIITVMQKPTMSIFLGYLWPLGKFGSLRGLCQPTAEELSQDQKESLKAQELLPLFDFHRLNLRCFYNQS